MSRMTSRVSSVPPLGSIVASQTNRRANPSEGIEHPIELLLARTHRGEQLLPQLVDGLLGQRE